jgi:hypothetical protein
MPNSSARVWLFHFTTAIAGVALTYALLAMTFTPPTSTLALLLPG